MTAKIRHGLILFLAVMAMTAGSLMFETRASALSGVLPQGLTDIFSTSVANHMADNAKDFLAKYGAVCWPCQVFNQFASTVFVKGAEISGHAQGPFTKIIGAVSVVFCLVYLGGGLIAGDASDIARRWTAVWKYLLGAALGVIFLGDSFNYMWDWVYGPVMAIPLAVSTEFGGMSTDMLTTIAQGLPCAVNPMQGVPTGAAGVASGMAGIVCGGHRLSAAGMAYGYALMMQANGFWGSLENIFTGLILIVVFVWVAITFPLRFIDILIRLTIIGILAPVLIVLAVFPQTRGYVANAIKNVLYAGCLFAFTGIMFNLAATIFSGLLENSIAGMAGNANMVTTLTNGIVLIAGGVIFSAMIKMAPELAKEFSGASAGSSMGDAANAAVSGAASLATKAAGGGVGAVTGLGSSRRATKRNAKAIGGQVAQALGKGQT